MGVCTGVLRYCYIPLFCLLQCVCPTERKGGRGGGGFGEGEKKGGREKQSESDLEIQREGLEGGGRA